MPANHMKSQAEMPQLAGATPTKAKASNTRKAYQADWAHYTRWCRMNGAPALPPTVQTVALYLSDLAQPADGGTGHSVATIERRLSGLIWNASQRGFDLDRGDRHLRSVLGKIHQNHWHPPAQKAPISAEDIRAMVATLPHDLRGLRDRAVLLLGYAGGLRRSEIVGLDSRKTRAPDSKGWVRLTKANALLTLRTKTGWREVQISRGQHDQTCPVAALRAWLGYARITDGPVFVRTSRDGQRALGTRLNDRHVARLIKQTVRDAQLRMDLPEAERLQLYSGQSLRAGPGNSDGL